MNRLGQLLQGLKWSPQAGSGRYSRHALRHSSSAALAALLVFTIIALLRPTTGLAGGRVDLMPTAIGAGAAAALAWCYLVDCGNHWFRLGFAQRCAVLGVLAVPALTAAALIKLALLILV